MLEFLKSGESFFSFSSHRLYRRMASAIMDKNLAELKEIDYECVWIFSDIAKEGTEIYGENI